MQADTIAAAVVCGLLFACSTWGRQHWLDETYPPGAPRSAAAIDDELQTNTFLWSILIEDERIEEIPSGADRALGDARLGNSVGFDAYDVRIWTGSRHARHLGSMCDYVFFDDTNEIVGVYRRRGSCPR